MLDWQTQHTSKNQQNLKASKSHQNIDRHGLHDSRVSILVEVPSETLTAITSYLDPPSLLSLARVNNLLHDHVKNDNTWHRAFVCRFLGIGPEQELRDNVKTLMLRRSESSWRKEFIARYRLRRRWERSRNATVTHVPVHSPISGMHVMPGDSLLSSSIQYGIVSRSFPLTGKILPGYLSASGSRPGQGVGNPNEEFTPDVSVSTFNSDGGTARVLWGFRSGEVAITTASRVMDPSRRFASEFLRCAVEGEHGGSVLDVIWADSAVVVSAGADGRVKVWDAKKVRCLWTSQRNPATLVPDACIKVTAVISRGLVVGVMRSGEIHVWTGFKFSSLEDVSPSSIEEVRFPYTSIFPPKDNAIDDSSHEATCIHVDTHAWPMTILVTYRGDSYFYRVVIESPDKLEITPFGDASFGALATTVPYFFHDSSFVLTGDHIGCVSVYDWRSPPVPGSAVSPVRKFEAHEDGSSVTALFWNGVTLITGSARGSLDVWDGLTFKHLRAFKSPIPRIQDRRHFPQGESSNEGVTQILVASDKETLIASVGNMVLSWRAGPAPKGHPGGVRSRHAPGVSTKKKDRSGPTKYLEKLEMNQTISESRAMLKLESDHIKKTHGREKEQRARLDSLGLDEVEALEYVLMLSRDEAMQNSRRSPSSSDVEGALEGDLNDIPAAASVAVPSNRMLSAKSRTPSPGPQFSNAKAIPPVLPRKRQTPRISHSRRNEKIRASTPSPEPSIQNARSFPLLNLESSSSSARSGVAKQSSVDAGQASSSKGKTLNNPSTTSSAWSTPMTRRSMTGSSGVIPRGMTSPGPPRVSSPRREPPRRDSVLDDMNEDLRFAIELSLAEARSRGDKV